MIFFLGLGLMVGLKLMKDNFNPLLNDLAIAVVFVCPLFLLAAATVPFQMAWDRWRKNRHQTKSNQS